MQKKKVRSLLVWNVAMLILFSVFYKMNAVFDKTAFNHVTLRTHKMSMTDCVYFSACTQSTVGFGDIHPVSTSAKVLVSLHICCTMLVNMFHILTD